MDQLQLDGMPRRLFVCTPSKLSTFADCPQRYRMTYLDRPALPKGPPWAHNSLGTSVHGALRAWWDEPLARRTPTRAAHLLRLGWMTDGWRDPDQSVRWRERAAEMVGRYVATLDPAREPKAVERQVAARTERLALSGRVDRLDDRDGELVVVDYKTGRRPLTDDDARASQALALYALAVSRTLRRPCWRVELHHVPTGDVAVAEHDEASLGRQLSRAEALADDIERAGERLRAGVGPDQAFPPQPGPLCSWCDYRRHCPQGRAAAPDRHPWEAVAGDEAE
ncbi:PD-(D/E)XK nuclease family protein [Frankia sp. Cppng1_Ct_nod]|uniref:RecB family exonuclease n=1 Tax=Frankia sp. Cppng1_Ct_nod TaxID=2897162 RepID=UPI0010414272|nr:PD-(D/E)XK nuclease family protein [Frankia sp. Cppng1_Ct_nod]